ncbi:hypothetical protein CAP35_13480 [Chitinophagaceae bacterium IBVUCB1]|nr:hypothetical protein CAP35_13480 [Chitinophagaceae bacterium IBVUCB1]
MTTSLRTVVAILLTIGSITAQAQQKFSAAHIGFVYPISTNGKLARYYTNAFSLHAIAGMSYAEKSFCASGISSYVFNNADGIMLAGFSNHVRNEMNGVQAAGFMNTVRNHVRGVQAAGFLNIAGSINGVQAAGFANLAFDSIKGIQAAGFLNICIAGVDGLQGAGFMNIATDIEGMQVAGFINTAGKVKGVQIAGFINIADSSDYPIAPVNIIGNGQKSLGITTYDGFTHMATFRSGGRVMYGLVGAGFHNYARTLLYAAEAGLGAHLRITKKLRVNIEGSSTSYTDFTDEVYLKSSLRIMPAYNIGNRLEVFAGPAINHVHGEDYNGSEISRNYLWSHHEWGYFNGIYLGFAAGMHFHL